MNFTSHKYFYPLILTIVFIGVYSYTFDAKVAQLGDNASYYMLGKAISTGEGYVNISKVSKTPNNHYPPGYPVLLSIGMIFTDGFSGLKLINGLCLLISIWLIYFISLKVTESRIMSGLIGLAVLFNFHLLQYGSMLMSEVPFMCFSLTALLLLINVRDGGNFLADRNFWFALVFGIIAYFTRTLGLALILAVVVHFATNKKWKAAGIYFAGFFVAALPWFIRGQQMGGGSYTRQLQMINPYRPELGGADIGDYIGRIGVNFSRYITKEIPYSLMPGEMPDYRSAATFGEWLSGILLAALIIYGLLKLGKFRFLLLGYAIFTFGILMLWPDVWVGPRFMIPLIPILYLGAFNGLNVLLSWVFGKANRRFNPGWLAVLVLFLLPSVGTLHEQAKTPLHPAWQNYYAVGQWLKQNENRDVVVSCGKPALFHLYSSTFTSRYAFENDTNSFLVALEEAEVDYVVLDQVYGNTYRYLLPAIQAHPERFQQVYSVKNPGHLSI